MNPPKTSATTSPAEPLAALDRRLRISFGLSELNGSGYSGVATLHDNGDGTTAVSVYLTEAGSRRGSRRRNGRTPAKRRPRKRRSRPCAAAVDIANFAFNPATIEIACWRHGHLDKQRLGRPHGDVRRSGIDPVGHDGTRRSFSFTFTTPGNLRLSLRIPRQAWSARSSSASDPIGPSRKHPGRLPRVFSR